MSNFFVGQQKWIQELEKLLNSCPSKRLGAYTVGDAALMLYDKDVSDAWCVENPRKVLDAFAQHAAAGSHLATITAGFQIDGCAG
ncbi:hypothetical protein LP417_35700 (plasmid) [Polaromonas sp. P1-6]|nr:hypothetical protein LP417_35700 [Polaromonas sp. P1-6]